MCIEQYTGRANGDGATGWRRREGCAQPHSLSHVVRVYNRLGQLAGCGWADYIHRVSPSELGEHRLRGVHERFLPCAGHSHSQLLRESAHLARMHRCKSVDERERAHIPIRS